jgi:hypothetical protein
MTYLLVLASTESKKIGRYIVDPRRLRDHILELRGFNLAHCGSEQEKADSEEPRLAPAVGSLELTGFSQSLGRFRPKESRVDPEVANGQKIAVGSCISCSCCQPINCSESITTNSSDHFR